MRAGDIPSGIFYLARGYVGLHSISKNGEKLILIIFRPGDIFPITWGINETPSDYYLEAITPSSLHRVPRSKFLDFVRANVDVLLDLTGRMLVRMSGLLTRMEYLVFGNAYNKVASILLICAERFGRREGRSVVIQVPLTHSDVAALIGISRETASIEIKKLEKKGIIFSRGRLFVIKNQRLLRRESLLDTY